jgi:hypothetical protein
LTSYNILSGRIKFKQQDLIPALHKAEAKRGNFSFRGKFIFFSKKIKKKAVQHLKKTDYGIILHQMYIFINGWGVQQLKNHALFSCGEQRTNERMEFVL